MSCQQSDSSYIYRIDERDLIVSVSDNWLAFAVANQADESCYPDRVINSPLWNYIDGLETSHLYRILLECIRSKNRAVTLPFRCDAPDRQRYLELKISPLGRGGVEFVSRIIREAPRESVRLLEAAVPRTDELVVMCSICKKVRLSEQRWVEVEDAIRELKLFERDAMPTISHGICPDCFRSWMERIESEDES